MDDLELPLGRKRSRAYRLLEMLPALLSFGLPVAIIVVSLVNASVGAWVVLAFVAVTVLRGVRGGIDAIRGYHALRSAERTDWSAMNAELERAIVAGRSRVAMPSEVALRGAIARRHAGFLIDAAAMPESYPKPSEVVHAVIVAAYNEPYEVIERSLGALVASSIGPERLVVMLAYEARGGAEMRRTAQRLERDFGHRFRGFELVEHPDDLPDEIPGKGANLTYAGHRLHEWLGENGIDERFVLVTSLDCDNQPHRSYFEALTYEYVRTTDRARASFQPISLFVGNIWHAPAPARIIAAGNSLWNLISTVRPFSLRNFASHAQPMTALVAMGYWSRRTIVEDGHQYWRSYFHFHGRYRVVPIHIPIHQDAVLTTRLGRTLTMQFRQLARWAYGASDVPYVGVRVFTKRRAAPFWRSAMQFVLLVESHVSLASVAPLILIGAWIPLGVTQIVAWFQATTIVTVGHGQVVTISTEAFARHSAIVSQLPGIVEFIERMATPGLVITIVLTALLLPARPREFGRTRSLAMLLQWILLPVTAIAYNAAAAMLSQFRLLFGRYRERFEVTEKATREPRSAAANDKAFTEA